MVDLNRLIGDRHFSYTLLPGVKLQWVEKMV